MNGTEQNIATLEFSFLSLTCFKFKMELVCVTVERARQGYPHLESLPSADDEVVTLVEVCVMFGAILPRLAFHQIYRLHFQKEFCEKKCSRGAHQVGSLYNFTNMECEF